MELIFKSAAAALTAAAIGLIIKKSNPEISMLLGAAAAVIILTGSMGFLKGIRELGELVKHLNNGGEALTAPIFKCLAAAVVTKLGSELCRDSKQGAAAAALELAGAVCAMSIAMPLIMTVLKIIGAYV